MKKYITIAALLAAGTAFANAETKTETILDVSFTRAQDSWVSGQWNAWNTPHFSYGENGAVIAQDWKQNTLSTDFSIDSGTDVSYTINFSTYGNGNEQSAMFYLSSSEDYTIVMGNSYDSNKEVAVGTLNDEVEPRVENVTTNWGRMSFQASATHPVTAVAKSETDDWVFQSLDYTLTLSSGSLVVDVAQGGVSKWNSGTINIKDSFSFDQIGFFLDGGAGNAGVKNISIKKTSPIPEPSAFGLLAGIGALALVASRRRRK